MKKFCEFILLLSFKTKKAIVFSAMKVIALCFFVGVISTANGHANRAPGEVCRECQGVERKDVCGTDRKTYRNRCLLECENRLQTDLRRCRTTTSGKEYVGHLDVTVLGRMCSSWWLHRGVYPTTRRQPDDPVVADNFPEQSIHRARNYCRNPDKSKTGLWCYTGNRDPYDFDYCDVPKCKKIRVAYSGECRRRRRGGSSRRRRREREEAAAAEAAIAEDLQNLIPEEDPTA